MEEKKKRVKKLPNIPYEWIYCNRKKPKRDIKNNEVTSIGVRSILRVTRESDGAVFDVWKYVFIGEGEHHVWCNDWYGRHIIGHDCDWF